MAPTQSGGLGQPADAHTATARGVPSDVETLEPHAADSLTPRGERTRATLLDAASRVLERKGYFATRVRDIVEEGGVSIGTFYKYFDSTQDVSMEILERMTDELYASVYEDVDSDRLQTRYERLKSANARYLSAYQSHAGLLRVLEQAASSDADFAAFRLALRNKFIERIMCQFQRWSADGLCNADYVNTEVAEAIASMVDRSAYMWFVLDDSREVDAAAEVLTRIWVRAVGFCIDDDPPVALEQGRRHRERNERIQGSQSPSR